MLAITLGLGTWQVERLHWKTALLADIDRAEQSPPILLPPDPAPFRRVVARGRLLPVAARYGAEVRSTPVGVATMGSQVIQPLQRDGAPTILVLRGWAPADVRPPTPDTPVEIVGYVRDPDHPGAFSLRDDPAARTFYTLDPQPIAAALGLGSAAPFTLVALGPPPPPGTYPEPAQALPRPPNDHLGYAITWFGLAAALAVIFALYARQALAPVQPAPRANPRPSR